METCVFFMLNPVCIAIVDRLISDWFDGMMHRCKAVIKLTAWVSDGCLLTWFYHSVDVEKPEDVSDNVATVVIPVYARANLTLQG